MGTLWQTRKESRQRFIKRWMEAIADPRESIHVFAIQDRPYTGVKVTLFIDGIGGLEGVGFSKVKWPDEWDAEFGQELAIRKALAAIYKRVMSA